MQLIIKYWKSLIERSFILAAKTAGRCERIAEVSAIRWSRLLKKQRRRRGKGLERPHVHVRPVPYFSVV